MHYYWQWKALCGVEDYHNVTTDETDVTCKECLTLLLNRTEELEWMRTFWKKLKGV